MPMLFGHRAGSHILTPTASILAPKSALARVKSGGGKTPAAPLVPPGSPSHWYDFTDISMLFQDSERATPVTATDQNVAGVFDQGTFAGHLDTDPGTGPVWKASGGVNDLGYLNFVGSSWIRDAAISNSWASDDERTYLVVIKPTFDNSGMVFDTTTALQLSGRIIDTNVQPSVYQDGTINTISTSMENGVDDSFDVGWYCYSASGTGYHKMSLNATTQSFSFTPEAKTNQSFTIGASPTGTLPYEGRFYELVIWIGVAPSASLMESYVTSKYGITWA